MVSWENATDFFFFRITLFFLISDFNYNLGSTPLLTCSLNFQSINAPHEMHPYQKIIIGHLSFL